MTDRIDPEFDLRARAKHFARRTVVGAERRVAAFSHRLSTASTAAISATKDSVTARYHDAAQRRRRARYFAGETSGQPVTLFIAPEAGLTPFFATHSLLARVLEDAGKTSVILSCDGMLPICSYKMAMRMQPTAPGDTQNPVCVRCRGIARKVGSEYALIDVPLESLLDATDLARIQDLAAQDPQALAGLIYDDIAFGTVCLGETLRDRRKTSLDTFSKQDVELMRGLVVSSLAIYFGLRKLQARHKIERILYFGDYAYYIAPQLIAKREGIPLTSISHAYNRDIDRRFASLRPGMGIVHAIGMAETWPVYANRPITPAHVTRILDGALYRLGGQGGASTFSPNFQNTGSDVLKELGLRPDRKTIVAYTSSNDEFICVDRFFQALNFGFDTGPLPFPDQDSWMHAIIAWAGAHTDRQLIIRLHPRMASNHRLAGTSAEVGKLQETLTNLPDNVVVVWPESKLSSYNLAEIADVGMVAWSSIGVELARFGIPVAGAFPISGGFPRDGVLHFRPTLPEYFAMLDQLLTLDPASIESVRQAFRWTNYVHWSHTIDVSDVVPEPDYDPVPPRQVPKNTKLILDVLRDGRDLVEINMAALTVSEETSARERDALIAAVREMIFRFAGVEGVPGAGLQVAADDGTSRTIGTAGLSMLLTLASNGECVFRWAGGEMRRRSPLVHRLGRMLLAEHGNAPSGS